MSEKVEFMPPKDFHMPEDSEDGKFDAVCTFEMKPDGSVCIVKMGDSMMPGYDKRGGKHDKPDYKEMAGGYAQQMGGMGGSPGGGGGY